MAYHPAWNNTPRFWEPQLAIVPMCAFDEKVKALGLKADELVGSKVLREWCKTNRFHKYVPEHLLDAWGMKVNESDIRNGSHIY